MSKRPGHLVWIELRRGGATGGLVKSMRKLRTLRKHNQMFMRMKVSPASREAGLGTSAQCGRTASSRRPIVGLPVCVCVFGRPRLQRRECGSASTINRRGGQLHLSLNRLFCPLQRKCQYCIAQCLCVIKTGISCVCVKGFNKRD